MTEEQKEKYANFLSKVSEILGLNRPVDILRLCAVTDEYFRPIEKRIAELEEKTSVLLSCENCPENKDGLICQKEYENKCLAQKIQYIKELKEENANLKALRKYELNVAKLEIEKLEKENAELKEKLKPENCLKLLAKEGYIKFTSDQLTKAKEIIEELYNIIPASMSEYAKEPMEHARKFMTEE